MKLSLTYIVYVFTCIMLKMYDTVAVDLHAPRTLCFCFTLIPMGELIFNNARSAGTRPSQQQQQK